MARGNLKERVDAVTMKVVDGCWLSEMSGTQISVNGRKMQLTHLVMELAGQPVPDELEVSHLCGQSRCINPDHIVLEDHLSNVRRDGNNMKTHCPKGHEFREQSAYYQKKGWRRCHSCHAEREAAHC